MNYLDRRKLLATIYKEIDEAGYKPSVYDISNDDNLIDFALSFLLSNLDEAFKDTIGIATDIDPELGW